MSGREHPAGMSIEHDFYCCSVRPLVCPLVSPQLCADNLECSSVFPRALFGAARFTVQYVRAVGQDVLPR